MALPAARTANGNSRNRQSVKIRILVTSDDDDEIVMEVAFKCLSEQSRYFESAPGAQQCTRDDYPCKLNRQELVDLPKAGLIFYKGLSQGQARFVLVSL